MGAGSVFKLGAEARGKGKKPPTPIFFLIGFWSLHFGNRANIKKMNKLERFLYHVQVGVSTTLLKKKVGGSADPPTPQVPASLA